MTTGQGHNSMELTEVERRVLFANHFRKDLQIENELRNLREQRKTNRKIAKAEGFSSAKLNHYLSAHFAEDKQKVIDEHNSDRENLAWMGLIPDTVNGDLLADRASSEQLIEAQGHNAGLLNRDRASGYDAGSSEDRTWLNGYDRGQKEFKDNLAEAMRKVEVARTNEEPAANGEDPFPGDED